MSASGKRLLAACIFALCSIPVLIVYTWVFTPDLIPHEGIWYCEELDATWDLNTSSGTIQVNGKQEAFVSLHQFYCNLFYFETEDRKNVFYGEVVRASRSKIVVQDTDSGEKYIFLRQDVKDGHETVIYENYVNLWISILCILFIAAGIIVGIYFLRRGVRRKKRSTGRNQS